MQQPCQAYIMLRFFEKRRMNSGKSEVSILAERKGSPCYGYIEWLSGEFFWICERGFLLYKYVFFFLSFISCRRNR